MNKRSSTVSNTSICGQRFSQETLPTCLVHSRAGQPRGWKIISIFLGYVLSTIAGITSAFLSTFLVISILHSQEAIQKTALSSTLISILVLGVLIVVKGSKYTSQKFLFFVIAISIAGGLYSPFPELPLVLMTTLIYNLFLISIFLISSSLLVFSNSVFLLVVKSKKHLNPILFLNVFLFLLVFLLSSTAFSRNDLLDLGILLTEKEILKVMLLNFLYSSLVIFTICYLSRNLELINRRFRVIYNYSLLLGSWGGTSFYLLDLSNKNFTNSDLANSDLRAKKFYRTCFRGVTGLNKSRMNNQYFDINLPKVQQLLVQGFSKESDFRRLNLKGAHLLNADLRRKNLTGANLSGSNLSESFLEESCLAHADLTGADLSGSNLTGACIDNWSINQDTVLSGVVCRFFYRKLDVETGEFLCRYPINKEDTLQLGDFEALVKRQNDTIDLIFQDGINWQAFLHSFKQLCQMHRSEAITIQSIEHQRKGSSIIRLDAGDANTKTKASIEQSAKALYAEDLKRLEAQVADYQGLLQDKVQENSELIAIVRTMAEKQGQTFNFNQNVGNVNTSEVKVSGDQIGIQQNNSTGNASLADSFKEIQELWNTFECQYASPDEKEFSKELASRAQKDPTFRQKLSKWGEKLAGATSEEAAKVAGGELAKRVIPHTLSLLVGLL